MNTASNSMRDALAPTTTQQLQAQAEGPVAPAPMSANPTDVSTAMSAPVPMAMPMATPPMAPEPSMPMHMHQQQQAMPPQAAGQMGMQPQMQQPGVPVPMHLPLMHNMHNGAYNPNMMQMQQPMGMHSPYNMGVSPMGMGMGMGAYGHGGYGASSDDQLRMQRQAEGKIMLRVWGTMEYSDRYTKRTLTLNGGAIYVHADADLRELERVIRQDSDIDGWFSPDCLGCGAQTMRIYKGREGDGVCCGNPENMLKGRSGVGKSARLVQDLGLKDGDDISIGDGGQSVCCFTDGTQWIPLTIFAVCVIVGLIANLSSGSSSSSSSYSSSYSSRYY